jgi:hypothetical protein
VLNGGLVTKAEVSRARQTLTLLFLEMKQNVWISRGLPA